jgi:hypothetical protein
VQSAGCTSQDGVIDDESLVNTRTNTCLSYTSAVPSYSVMLYTVLHVLHVIRIIEILL